MLEKVRHSRRKQHCPGCTGNFGLTPPSRNSGSCFRHTQKVWKATTSGEVDLFVGISFLLCSFSFLFSSLSL